MPASSWFLFAVPVLVWSTTFFVITFQLNSPTTPAYAVAIRFMVAALLLFIWVKGRKLPIKLSGRHHGIAATSGVCAYGISYVLTYLSELVIPSGLVAIAFTLMVFFTPLFARIAHGTKITRATWIGGSIGLFGVSLMFLPDLLDAGATTIAGWGVGAMLVAALVSSIASVLSIQLNRDAVPVVIYTAWAMFYGASATFIYALLSGQTLVFDPRLSFWLALAYLSWAGTLLAFLCYLILLKREGPTKAMYISVLSPVGAVIVSVFIEGLRPAALTWFGIGISLVGAWYTLTHKQS